MTKPSSCLIVFAKYPEVGKVKTRLAQMTSYKESAAFFEASLLDSLDQYLTLDNVDVFLFMAGEDKFGFASSLPEGLIIRMQTGTGLGERMSNAFDHVFNLGYTAACVIGTDHPTLDLFHIDDAFSFLTKEGEIVIGPSLDGGYYLLGMSGPKPRLFEDMSYSHDKVFSETLARAHEYSMDAVKTLIEWYDVDEPEDLKRLSDDLYLTSIPLPRVRKIVSHLSLKYKDHSRFSRIINDVS